MQPKLNDSEWAVMQAVWTDPPATAREVHGQVAEARGWTYSTVRTLLLRLEQKGALRSTRAGRRLVFTPLVSADEARRSALRSLVDRAFGGRVGSLVQQLAADEHLGPDDRAQIERMLTERQARDAPIGIPNGDVQSEARTDDGFDDTAGETADETAGDTADDTDEGAPR